MFLVQVLEDLTGDFFLAARADPYVSETATLDLAVTVTAYFKTSSDARAEFRALPDPKKAEMSVLLYDIGYEARAELREPASDARKVLDRYYPREVK